jgi:uncharacterized repeat protein (TIGR01451 family)
MFVATLEEYILFYLTKDFARLFSLLLIIILLGIITFIPTQPAQAATFTVNDAASLIAAINTANGNGEADIITLNADVTLTIAYAPSTNTGGGRAGLPDITSDITIVAGAGTTITRDSNSSENFRIFYIGSGGSLTLDGITVSNGHIAPSNSVAYGGGIFVDTGGTLALHNSTLSGNSVTGSSHSDVIGKGGLGGGIYNLGTIDSIDRSSLSGNSAIGGNGYRFFPIQGGYQVDGGGPGIGGGIWNGGTITEMSNCTLSNNTAIAGREYNDTNGYVGEGGGIWNGGIITEMSNCLIVSNSALTHGHGHPSSPGSTIRAIPTASGGGIHNEFIIGTISNCLIADNLVTTTAAITNLFNLEIVRVSGGGIWNEGYMDIISNSTISGNRIIGVNYVLGGGISNSNSINTIINSTLSGNSAVDASYGITGGARGGGIYSNNTSTNLIHVTMLNNTASTEGDAIYHSAGVNNPNLVDSIVASPGGVDDCVGTADNGNNLGGDASDVSCTSATIDVATDIGPLADNGCAILLPDGSCVLTHELLGAVGSNPAIDTASGCPTGNMDERDYARDANCDIGAYEAGPMLETDLSIDKTVGFTATGDANGDGLYDAGDEIVYTLVVINTGSTGISTLVTDFFPAGIEAVSWSASFTGGASGITSDFGDIVEVIHLPTGGVATYTATGTIAVAANGTTVSNTASVSHDHFTDLDPSNNLDMADFYVEEIVVADSEDNSGGQAQIGIFDPAISKLGFLLPGQTGVAGEQIEWVVTVSNTGTAAGQNIVVVDTLIDALQVDSVDAPGATVTITGQTVAVTYATINPGEVFQFSIFTTVLSGAEISNTACVSGYPDDCATSTVIRNLPATGELPEN